MFPRVIAVLLIASSASAQPTPREVALAAEADRLETALARAAHRFDPVSYLSAQRSMLVAVFESYCAIGFLVPPSEDTVDIVLGAGCLLGAATLTYMTYRGFAKPRAERDARERLDRFLDARANGFVDFTLDDFEGELEAAAHKDRRRRRFAAVFGMLNFAATATLAGLVARDRIGRTPGTVIATGTGAVGVLGISALFVQGSSEYAWGRF